MDIFAFDPRTVSSFLLTLLRLSIILYMLPFFGGRSLPKPAKAALLLVLALAFFPQRTFPPEYFPDSVLGLAVMGLGEVVLGLVLGLTVRFLFAAVQFGGAIMGFQMGFAMVNIVDPLTGVNEPVTSHFLYMVTLLTFLAVNGHLLLLRGLGESFALIPPGGLVLTPKLGATLLGFSEQIFILGIKIAAPVMGAVILVDLSLALISRVAPQMHLLVFGFPIKIAVGFFFLSLVFVLMARFAQQFTATLGRAMQILMEMGAPTP